MQTIYFILLFISSVAVFSQDTSHCHSEKKEHWRSYLFSRHEPKHPHKKFHHRRMQHKIFDFVTVLQIEDDIIEATSKARILKENFARREELLKKERQLLMKELEYLINEQKQGRSMHNAILQTYKKLYNNTSDMQTLVLEHVNTLQQQSQEIYNKYIEKTSTQIVEFEKNPQQLTETLLKLYNKASY